MTPRRFTPQAFALAHQLTLQDYLWERPQVEGITIDGPDSRDLDDAIWIESTPTGAILSIHIADVSELVTIGSALDKFHGKVFFYGCSLQHYFDLFLASTQPIDRPGPQPQQSPSP